MLEDVADNQEVIKPLGIKILVIWALFGALNFVACDYI